MAKIFTPVEFRYPSALMHFCKTKPCSKFWQLIEKQPNCCSSLVLHGDHHLSSWWWMPWRKRWKNPSHWQQHWRSPLYYASSTPLFKKKHLPLKFNKAAELNNQETAAIMTCGGINKTRPQCTGHVKVRQCQLNGARDNLSQLFMWNCIGAIANQSFDWCETETIDMTFVSTICKIQDCDT